MCTTVTDVKIYIRYVNSISHTEMGWCTATTGSCGSRFPDLCLSIDLSSRFKPAIVKECIREIVRERLSGMQYDPEEVPELSRSLAESIKDKVKRE